MADIFISYKTERRPAAEHLAEILQYYGYSVWFDYSLLKGQDFEFQLDRELRAARAVIILWCSMSVDSEWVGREAALAAKLGTLLPTKIEDCELKLAHINRDFIDLRNWDGAPRSHHLDPLLRAMERLVGRPRTPDWQALAKYEEVWRRFGGRTLAEFALTKPLERPQSPEVDPRRHLDLPAAKLNSNPKPLMHDDLILDNVFVMAGDDGEPMEFACKYIDVPINIVDPLAPIYNYLARRVEHDARQAGRVYFNGPNTRLLRIAHDNAQQASSGEEQIGQVLELGPVSWEEYSVLHNYLDDNSIIPGQTIRERLADVAKLYEFSPDLRWCPLSNILTVACVPITTDGYGLIQRRSSATSADPGKLSVIAENIHRFWDEALPDDLGARVHSLGDKEVMDSKRNQQVDHNYIPLGVPSPLLAMQRGVYEEFSKHLHAMTIARSSAYKFLAVLFGLHHFRPAICGIVDLGFSLEETKKMVGQERGRDHWEYNAIVPLHLDLARNESRQQILDETRWVDVGLGAFVLAAKYYRHSQQRS